MSGLRLLFLGPPRLERDGELLALDNRKALALLAYLVVTGHSHSRDGLATLLWPDYDQRQARSNLRYSLWALKKALGEGWLAVERESIALEHNDRLWLDVVHFRELLAACREHSHPVDEVCPACLPLLSEAAGLYRGDFLIGFSLSDSPDFDEWQFFQSEGWRRELAGVLEKLVRGHTAQGEYEPAIGYARRWLTLDPLHEPAHRYLIELYNQTDQQAAALRQYRECVRVLAEELNASPSAETSALYEAIKRKRVVPPPTTVQVSRQDSSPIPPFLPSFLAQERDPAAVVSYVFVARERELARLDELLNAAFTGHGQVVFVTGEAGSGKSALLWEFARQAQEKYANLIVASGNCNAQTGLGDPYLPFREILRLLTGDVETAWTRGLVSREHASHLWAMLPILVQALLELGPDLINTFIPGPTLLSRAITWKDEGTSWLAGLEQLIARKAAGTSDLGQRDLFEQYTNVLLAVARQQPLLLIVDDLHWADTASLSLLFHLARRLEGSRILILGAYRSDEVALGRPLPSLGQSSATLSTFAGQKERHPLEPVINELKRTFGEIEIDLDQAQGRQFVETWLDTQPNRLGLAFRLALYQHTRGQPLFTIELLRAMQEREDIVRDEQGRWVEGPALDWGKLPARVEAVVEERIGRLAEELRATLTVASVEGGEFTAQVVAQVQAIQERQLLQQLSRELEKRHRLVRHHEAVQVGQRLLTRFQFVHNLFQQYLYNDLSISERRLLHGEIATVLEALYAGQTDEITVHLARHYAEAGEKVKAIEYLLGAGDQARGLYAHQEAVEAYRRALGFLQEQGDYERAARTLMKLGLTHHQGFDFQQARQAFEEGFALWQRAGEIQPTTPLLPAPHPLRVRWFNPLTLDSTTAWEMISAEVIDHLFSGLVALSPELDVVPAVARTWDVLEDGREYVFHLRQDARWSDGIPVTAEDFVYAWRRVLDPAIGSSLGSMLLYDIQGARVFHRGEQPDPDSIGVKAVDNHTLIVTLEGPTSYFLHLLTEAMAYPVPRHVVEKHGQAWTKMEHIVGNGPFRLEAWQEGQSMLLSRNPHYRGLITGNVEQVELSLLPEGEWSTSLTLYETDKLDSLNLWHFPPLEMVRIRQRYAGEYVSGPWLFTDYVGLDASRPPFDDARVRLAFVLATDRETLADLVLGGYVYPATGGFIPPGMPGHSAGISLRYDPDRARQLMAEAGYPGGHGFPLVEALTRSGRELVIEYLQTQWRKNLGIEINWQIMETMKFFKRLDREPPAMFLIGVRAVYPDPDIFMRARFPIDYPWLRNEALDKLIERARHIVDQAERLKLYEQADQILIEEAAIIPLTYWRRHMLVKPWVRKFPTSAIKTFFWKDTIIEPH